MVEGVKRLTVTMLVSKPEARSPKNETRVSSIYNEPRYELRQR